MYCEYYRASVVREKIWFLSACLRNESHLAFARAVDGASNVFEFFVPKDLEQNFVAFIKEFEARGVVTKFEKLPNRLEQIDYDL